MEQSNESAPVEQTSQKHSRKHRRSDSLGLTAAEDQLPASNVKPVLPALDPERKASALILKSEPLSPVSATNISASKANVRGGSPGPGSVAYAPSYSLLGGQGVGAQGPFEPLKRVTRACDMCHARKTKCDNNVPCRACAALGADCTKTIEPMHRGPRSKALQRQHEIVGLGTAITTTSELDESNSPKRRRLNTNQAQEAVGVHRYYEPAIVPSQVPSVPPLLAIHYDLSFRSQYMFTPMQCQTILELIRRGNWPIQLLFRSTTGNAALTTGYMSGTSQGI